MTHETMGRRQNGNKMTLQNNQIDCKITRKKRQQQKTARECGKKKKQVNETKKGIIQDATQPEIIEKII